MSSACQHGKLGEAITKGEEEWQGQAELPGAGVEPAVL